MKNGLKMFVKNVKVFSILPLIMCCVLLSQTEIIAQSNNSIKSIEKELRSSLQDIENSLSKDQELKKSYQDFVGIVAQADDAFDNFYLDKAEEQLLKGKNIFKNSQLQHKLATSEYAFWQAKQKTKVLHIKLEKKLSSGNKNAKKITKDLGSITRVYSQYLHIQTLKKHASQHKKIYEALELQSDQKDYIIYEGKPKVLEEKIRNDLSLYLNVEDQTQVNVNFVDKDEGSGQLEIEYLIPFEKNYYSATQKNHDVLGYIAKEVAKLKQSSEDGALYIENMNVELRVASKFNELKQEMHSVDKSYLKDFNGKNELYFDIYRVSNHLDYRDDEAFNIVSGQENSSADIVGLMLYLNAHKLGCAKNRYGSYAMRLFDGVDSSNEIILKIKLKISFS